jgi:hypothetical protein
MKLDGVNCDGVSGWELLLDSGVIVRRDWHCDYTDTLDRVATQSDLQELLSSSEREWPRSLPECAPGYRDISAMLEWNTFLRRVFLCPSAAAPPLWFACLR